MAKTGLEGLLQMCSKINNMPRFEAPFPFYYRMESLVVYQLIFGGPPVTCHLHLCFRSTSRLCKITREMKAPRGEVKAFRVTLSDFLKRGKKQRTRKKNKQLNKEMSFISSSVQRMTKMGTWNLLKQTFKQKRAFLFFLL